MESPTTAVAWNGGVDTLSIFRHPTAMHIEMPIGVRVDGHVESDGSSDVIVAAQVDLVPIGVLGLALAQALHMHD